MLAPIRIGLVVPIRLSSKQMNKVRHNVQKRVIASLSSGTLGDREVIVSERVEIGVSMPPDLKLTKEQATKLRSDLENEVITSLPRNLARGRIMVAETTIEPSPEPDPEPLPPEPPPEPVRMPAGVKKNRQ